MLRIGWLTLKQAQEAIRAGRLEDAQQLLARPQVQGYRRVWELLRQLMKAYVDRGETNLRQENPAEAWSDLLKAEKIGISDNGVNRLRQALNRLGLAEVRALLDAGEPARALEVIARLRSQKVQQPELDPLEAGAKEWILAQDYAKQGEFSQALQSLERVEKTVKVQTEALQFARKEYEHRKELFDPLFDEILKAAQEENWQQVLRLADTMLAQAPQHAEVRQLRKRAWKAIEPATVIASPPKHLQKAENQKPKPNGSKKFILWIDGVGGYLICMGSEVTIGQSCPDSIADITLFCDVSRHHLTLTRDSECYVLKAERTVKVNAQEVDRTLINPGDRITLGSSCQLLFRQDVPISTTARIDLVSGHRFGLPIDGAILMSETLLIGPGPQANVLMDDLDQTVIIFRTKDGLGVRSTKKFFLNGEPVSDRAHFDPGAKITGSNFSMTLESQG